MIICGMLGMVRIFLMTAHSMKHFLRNKIIRVFQKVLYIIYFLIAFLCCCSYALLRTDLILPMGTEDGIDCKLGLYITTNTVFLSKVLLFSIFVYRIDSAFHASALGYPRSFLLCLLISYYLICFTLNAAHIYTSWPLVIFEKSRSEDVIASNISNDIGLCTTSSNRQLSVVLGALFLGDMIFSVIVCALFVYKLRKV